MSSIAGNLFFSNTSENLLSITCSISCWRRRSNSPFSILSTYFPPVHYDNSLPFSISSHLSQNTFEYCSTSSRVLFSISWETRAMFSRPHLSEARMKLKKSFLLHFANPSFRYFSYRDLDNVGIPCLCYLSP